MNSATPITFLTPPPPSLFVLGIVPLEGATLTDCAHTYFRQSVQLEAVIKVAVDRIVASEGEPLWRAGAMMLQRLEQRGVQHVAGEGDNTQHEEAWRRAVILMGSCTSDELLDATLHPNDLLYRLFHEDGVRVFDPMPLDMRSGAMMLQRLEQRGVQHVAGEGDNTQHEEAWRRAVILMGSCTSDELLDATLHPNDLLYRLFHEDGVRVFDPMPLDMRCRCSRDRVENVLRSFPRDEIETMKVGEDVVVTCEFCNADYLFDTAAIDALYAARPSA